MMSTIQNLPPIMPFIEPTEPIELPSVIDLKASKMANNEPNQTDGNSSSSSNIDQVSHDRKGKSNANDGSNQDGRSSIGRHSRAPSVEEAILAKTRMELEMKICELNQLKNQLAQTEQREKELASRIAT